MYTHRIASDHVARASRPILLCSTVALMAVTLQGCGDERDSTATPSDSGGAGPGTGGAEASGPSGAVGSGGQSAVHTGGSLPAGSGGTTGGGTGTGAGGLGATGGRTGTGFGGADGVGGAATGGRASGGAGPSTGGVDATSTGGRISDGGASAGGTNAGVGGRGVEVSGGRSAMGGTSGSGGTSQVDASGSGQGSAGRGGTSGTEPLEGGIGGVATGGAGTGGTPVNCESTYENPIIWEDLPDLEVIRVDDTYYYTASSFHHSPGAPILRSYDLIHWEYIGHSVPVLDFDPSYDLDQSRSYVNGIWASSLRYRESNQTFYWIGCMHNKGGGYVFTASAPEGPWTKHSSQKCYYDVGMLIDDDDTMYVAYGNTTLYVAQLSEDGFSEVRSQKVFDSPSDIGALEGSRFYKINGDYYIFPTQYANGEYVLRSTSGPFGPYTLRTFAVRVPFSVAGAGASPHQGGIIETQNGDWYYMAFNDSYPAGRIPVLAPVTWNDGWPSVDLDNNAWGGVYPFPNLPCGAGRVRPSTGVDDFSGPTLRPEWEWNHNPDNSKWLAGGGLLLETATVTDDLYAARNTLTRRMIGPTSTATIELDYSGMADGDVAGLAALRDSSAWIGVKRSGDAHRVVMVNNVNLDSSWNTSSKGTEVADAEVEGGRIWLRVVGDIRTSTGGGQARFYFSTDGSEFTELGNAFTMKKEWQYFLGYRFGIFNYATKNLGGSVTVDSFELAQP